QLTDLAHVAELLHSQAAESQLSLPALLNWLARRLDEGEGAEAEGRSRRLGSDAAAVQVLTVHRAKGLEFPVVYCPYLWDPGRPDRRDEPVVFHDPDSEQRQLDVGGSENGEGIYPAHFQLSHQERRGEDLRHLYVAFTRAKHQVVIWWAGAHECQHSALGRLLLARSQSGDVSASGRPGEPNDRAVEVELQRLGAKAPGLISLERCQVLSRPGTVPRQAVPPSELARARLERPLDLGWRRSSYSSITAAVHGRLAANESGPSSLVSSEPEQIGIADEPAPAQPVPGDSRSDAAPHLPSVFRGVPSGTDVGTFVHLAMQRVDFAAADLYHEALEAISAIQPAPLNLRPEVLAEALEAAIRTPLGPMVAGSLREVGRDDRLDELYFELPLAGGDDPHGEVLLASLAALLAEAMPLGHPLHAYATTLTDPLLVSSFRGYLTGSLDLVLRHQLDGVPRYFVVDYKTNCLGGPEEQLTTWHYRPAALGEAMARAHYPLQALFYMVALHRYLRWRQPGYDPALHLGGSLYLFLRGMAGPSTPAVDGQACGVFGWAPGAELIVRTSELLARPSEAGR
ncbi:MAG TPA: 3'-5' exonuclease, partial [Acidimicrobiales bacterium]|nr:3'-5' exonuclease [Acidimicrobiales bacterium]